MKVLNKSIAKLSQISNYWRDYDWGIFRFVPHFISILCNINKQYSYNNPGCFTSITSYFSCKFGKRSETSVLAKDMLSRGVLLNAKIKDPEGSVVFSETFDDKILSSFTPRISGTYTYVVISLSSDGTTIKGSIGNPFVVERIANAETAGDILGPEFSLWAYAGLGVFVGVIIVIAGAIKFVMSKIRLRKYFTNKNSTEEIPVKEWDEPK